MPFRCSAAFFTCPFPSPEPASNQGSSLPIPSMFVITGFIPAIHGHCRSLLDPRVFMGARDKPGHDSGYGDESGPF
jgi:hypothetical protein